MASGTPLALSGLGHSGAANALAHLIRALIC
jgi:hypothetical protein